MALKALAKVQKKIIGKKKAKAGALHERSRDSKSLQRAELREDKITRATSERVKQNVQYHSRVAVFSAAAKHRDESEPFTLEEVQDLIVSFIARTGSELDELLAARRPGRPPTGRQQQLEARIDKEKREYVGGMWVPDMMDPANLKGLAKWGGEWPALGQIKFVRVGSNGDVKPSTFPPNGRS